MSSWLPPRVTLRKRLDVCDQRQCLFFGHLPSKGRHDRLEARSNFGLRIQNRLANICFVEHRRSTADKSNGSAVEAAERGTSMTPARLVATGAVELREQLLARLIR